MLYSKNKKRGFTLVELIVVLVILAILAALLIPALTGYIDKAKKDQVIAETRMLHEAVQTEMSEIYGSSAQWRTTAKGATTIASSEGTAIMVWRVTLMLIQQPYKIVAMRLLNYPKFPVCKLAPANFSL